MSKQNEKFLRNESSTKSIPTKARLRLAICRKQLPVFYGSLGRIHNSTFLGHFVFYAHLLIDIDYCDEIEPNGLPSATNESSWICASSQTRHSARKGRACLYTRHCWIINISRISHCRVIQAGAYCTSSTSRRGDVSRSCCRHLSKS